MMWVDVPAQDIAIYLGPGNCDVRNKKYKGGVGFPNQGYIIFQPLDAFYQGTWLCWPQIHPKWIPK